MEGGLNEIKALQSLLYPAKRESDSEDDLPQAGARKFGPGEIGSSKSGEIHVIGPHETIKPKDKDIWDSSEASNVENPEINDPRELPQYEMKFKQCVTPEDMFLGMGFKTTSSASCEWLSICVKLPEEIREKVQLSVESSFIDLRSPRYRLHLPTPHPVDPNASSARWHGDTSTLEINLRLVRELDEVNF